ncbi:MAG: hypothetical protein ABSF80_02715 [Chitinispirillaceae bacterium]|jgi:hypothetical protein
MPLVLDLSQYPFPSFLEGRCTPAVYYKWLNKRADSVFTRDKKRRKPFALTATREAYKMKIHKAVVDGGLNDPYTGEPLAWDLIGTWDTSHKQPDGYEKRFTLLPTIDHITPDVLDFEIYSYQINKAKNDLNPAEFVELCKKVVQFRENSRGNS